MSEVNDLNETFEETMDESTVITVPIDDTLSNSGEAADAARVNELNRSGVNYFTVRPRVKEDDVKKKVVY